jgi:hypothetical protein
MVAPFCCTPFSDLGIERIVVRLDEVARRLGGCELASYSGGPLDVSCQLGVGCASLRELVNDVGKRSR